MDLTDGIKPKLFFLFFCCAFLSYGQGQSGKIVFERKTNLEKKLKDIEGDWIGDFLRENKTKVETFELYFTENMSLFKPEETDEVDETSWATSQNTILQNFSTDKKITLFNLWGQEVVVSDINKERNWQITENKRMIGKYECRKAIWQKNDSTRIYAWFSIDILPSVGPEGFDGLPGAILGLATEDGGIIYFAKSVELTEVQPEVFDLNLKKKKILTIAEFQKTVETDFGDSPWGKRLFNDLFRWL